MDFELSRQRLSSDFTFLYKFIFPIVWLSAFGLGTVWALVTNNGRADELFFAFIAGGLMFYWLSFPLKLVELEENYLYVSNYRKTIKIPVSKIENVTEVPFLSVHPIWIRFKSSTVFGRTIVFIPYFHFRSLFWMSHPVAMKLRELTGPILYI